MCGIVGVASGKPVANRSWLSLGRDALVHRGPDDAGEWWSEDGRVGLAHRRLAILDLTSAGHQPMQDPHGAVIVVFNGEIYNYREIRNTLSSKGYEFHTGTDTEVLLAAYQEWGVDCLQRLNGMFAFAIYDSIRKTIFLARDRAGEKPLFYNYKNGVLRFGSELKGLLADRSLSRQIDLAAMSCYLNVGFVPGDLCILKGFHKLPAAHGLLYHLNTQQLSVWRYWDLTLPSEGSRESDVDEKILLDELDALLEDSVRHQLIADVPVGILLSGGLDSSLITAMAARAAGQVRTYTIRFSKQSKWDEGEHARLIARHFNTIHSELEANPDALDILPRLARQFDEPIADSSMIPTFLISEIVSQECTVALGGDGGDELFGGYLGYRRTLRMQRWLGWIPRLFRSSVAAIAERTLPVGTRGRMLLQSLDCDYEGNIPPLTAYFDVTTARHLLGSVPCCRYLSEEFIHDVTASDTDLVQRLTRTAFLFYLADDILVKTDRCSMLNSLELRAPLLDRQLVEFAFRKVPSRLKATHGDLKILMKRLGKRLLPPDFDIDRKHGFGIPITDWLRNERYSDVVAQTLMDASCVFERRAIDNLFKGFHSGRNLGGLLFTLYFFELWRNEYSVSI